MNVTNEWKWEFIVRRWLEAFESDYYRMEVSFIADAVRINFFSVHDAATSLDEFDDESLNVMTIVMFESADENGAIYVNHTDDAYYEFSLYERDGFEGMFVNMYPALDYVRGIVREFEDMCHW